jgi:hypothetical protein
MAADDYFLYLIPKCYLINTLPLKLTPMHAARDGTKMSFLVCGHLRKSGVISGSFEITSSAVKNRYVAA